VHPAIVAPAVLHTSTQPTEVVGYRLGFTTNASTTVQASITADAGGAPQMKQSPNAVAGGVSTISWMVGGQNDGSLAAESRPGDVSLPVLWPMLDKHAHVADLGLLLAIFGGLSSLSGREPRRPRPRW